MKIRPTAPVFGRLTVDDKTSYRPSWRGDPTLSFR